MALHKRGKFFYGDDQSDIRAELLRYSRKNEYPAVHFRDASCPCGSNLFRLFVDDDAGAAIRICHGCNTEHPIGDSRDFLGESTPGSCECPCGVDSFEVTCGVALYEGSKDARWFYIGCRCPECSLTACYGDWKNEFQDYRILLDRV